MKKTAISLLISVIFSSCAPVVSQYTQVATLSSTLLNTPIPSSTSNIVPNVYLSQLTPSYVSVGAGLLGVGDYAMPFDPGFDGKPIQAHGISFPNGLMAHAPSQVDYKLEGDFRLFKTEILMQQQLRCGDGVVFRVLLDESEVFASQPVLPSSEPQKIELDISGVQKLSLIVDMQSDNNCDWAIWGDPLLVPSISVAANYPTATSAPTPTFNPNLPCLNTQADDYFVFLDCMDIIKIRENINKKENRYLINRLHNLNSEYVEGLAHPDDPATLQSIGSSDLNHWLLFRGVDSPTRQLGLEYLLTGDPLYSEAIVKVLQILAQTDNGGIVLPIEQITDPFLSLVFAYSVVRNTRILSESEIAFYDKFFFIQSSRILQLSYPDDWQSLWNPGIRNVAMVATVALYFQKDVRFETLYQQAKSSVFGRISKLVNDEGGYKELTDNYSPVVLNSVVLYAEAEYKKGNDIYSKRIGNTSIHDMCRWFIYEMTPEGTLPAINDGWFESYSPGIFRLCGNRTTDPELIFAADKFSDGQKNGFQYYPQSSWMNPDSIFDQIVWNESSITPQKPGFTSILLPQSGLAVLRDGWDKNSQYALMMFTPTTHHEHYSFGNINIYDQIPWIIDNGYQFESGKATKDHSTITIDDSNQKFWGGTSEAFSDLGNSGFISVKSKPYPDFQQTRSVLWFKPLHQWIIVDDGDAQNPHSIALRWFVLGTSKSENNNNTWVFTQLPGSLKLVFLPGIDMEYSWIERSYIEGKSPGTSGGVEGKATVSAWPVHLATLMSTSQLLSGSRTDAENGFTISSIFEDAKSLEWAYSYQPGLAVEFPSISILGKAGCVVHESEHLKGYCLFLGTSLSSQGKDLTESNKPFSIDVDFSSGKIVIENTNTTMVRLYWPEKISGLWSSRDNQSVPFTWDNGILQFESGTGYQSYSVTP
jgi:hypothetical protein